MQRIAVTSGERKVNLLRAIIESNLQGAEDEVNRLRAQYERGLIGAGQVTAADSKVKMLKLILGSAK